MLKISNLEVNYGKMQVIKGISLEVKEGELISVIGPNGAGKTTLSITLSEPLPDTAFCMRTRPS